MALIIKIATIAKNCKKLKNSTDGKRVPRGINKISQMRITKGGENALKVRSDAKGRKFCARKKVLQKPKRSYKSKRKFIKIKRL